MKYAFLAFLLCACGSTPTTSNDAGSGVDASPDVTTVDAGIDAPPEAAVDAGYDGPIPIKHVVVIVKENHTFDNYFGSFPGAEGTTTCTPPTAARSRARTRPTRRRAISATRTIRALTDWNHGAMNGWDLVAGATQNGDNLAYAQYHESRHSQLLGIRADVHARRSLLRRDARARASPATSSCSPRRPGWAVGNPDTQRLRTRTGAAISARAPRVTCSEPEHLHSTRTCSPASTSRRCPTCCRAASTGSSTARTSTCSRRSGRCSTPSTSIRNGPGWSNVVNAPTVRRDIAAGTLPAVSLARRSGSRRRAPAGRQRLQRRELDGAEDQQAHAVEYWKDTAILFTMDDFGGWYDHVAPPRQYGCDAEHALRARLPPAAHRHLAVREAGLRLQGGLRAGEHPALHRDGLRRDADAARPRSRRAGRAGERSAERVRLQADAARRRSCSSSARARELAAITSARTRRCRSRFAGAAWCRRSRR